MDQFKIGVAREIITPPLGTMLYGYVCKRPAAVVNDDLTVNAISIEQGNTKAIMISADLVSIGSELADRIRTLVSQETNVPAKNISFSVTHTHSGPAIKTANGWGSSNEKYIEEILIPKTITASKRAMSSMMAATMGVGTTHSKVGINRRELMQDGKVRLGQNIYGMYDSLMTVMSFKSLEGAPIVNLVHYGCHGTSAGRGLEITRDWAGVMVDRMEIETGATTVYFNGAEGDVGPRLSNGRTTGDVGEREAEDHPCGDIRFVYELGSVASIDAMTTFRNIKNYKDVEFQVVSDVLRLPYDKQPTQQEAEDWLQKLGDPDKLQSVQFREYAKVCGILDMYKNNQSFDSHLEIEQTLFAFNSVVFVPFHFELFSEISLRLRDYSPFEHTLCLCNTNGSNFYLPSQDQMVRGGYEIDVFRNGSVYKLKDDTDNTIINENMRLIDKLKV